MKGTLGSVASVKNVVACEGTKRYVIKFAIVATLIALGYWKQEDISELASYISTVVIDRATSAYTGIMSYQCNVSMSNSFWQNQLCTEYGAVLNDAKVGTDAIASLKSNFIKAGGIGGLVWATWNNLSAILSGIKTTVSNVSFVANTSLDVIIDAFCNTTVTSDRLKDAKEKSGVTKEEKKGNIKEKTNEQSAAETSNAAGSGSGSGSGTGLSLFSAPAPAPAPAPATEGSQVSARARRAASTAPPNPKQGGRRTRRHRNRRQTRRY